MQSAAPLLRRRRRRRRRPSKRRRRRRRFFFNTLGPSETLKTHKKSVFVKSKLINWEEEEELLLGAVAPAEEPSYSLLEINNRYAGRTR